MTTGAERFLASLIHIEEKRDPNSVVRRTDFNYLGGHGTFYTFDENHFPDLLRNFVSKTIRFPPFLTDRLSESLSRINTGSQRFHF